MKYLFAILTLMLFSTTTQAGPLAGKLAQSCQSKDAFEQGLCIGYFTGLSDGSAGIDVTMDNGDVVEIVYADNVTVTQVIHVFIKYVSDNPEIENKDAAGVYVTALVKAKLMGFKPIAKKPVDQ